MKRRRKRKKRNLRKQLKMQDPTLEKCERSMTRATSIPSRLTRPSRKRNPVKRVRILPLPRVPTKISRTNLPSQRANPFNPTQPR